MDEPNEWTLMFFFAGDNSLAPSMISQLKAIKDAGFQKNITVLVRYDPNEIGARTRIFEVNRERKERYKTHVGDGRDPFVRNLREDVVTRETIEKKMMGNGITAPISEATNALLNESDTTTARDALDHFLIFCREHYSARHYMLFLVGHGMIVGNDAFLPDDRPDTGVSLKQLGEILDRFTKAIQDKAIKDKGALELVGMHSCSMSAIEVAYELKGKANYMMATEGISFVGSWPYRQLLKKIFNTVDNARGNNVRALLSPLIRCCLHNSTDFMFAGFSADLCLCNLKKVEKIEDSLRTLTRALKAGLKEKRGQELILLAHWEAQSYWQENYTDLYDFCRCLSKRCEDDLKPDENIEPQKSIKGACDEAKKVLEQSKSYPFGRLVVFSDHFGPTYQYSHGLSIYFPWSSPIKDGVNDVLGKYEEYEFSIALGRNSEDKSHDDSWLSFLEEYFKETRRVSREVEDGGKPQESTDQAAEISTTGNVSGNLVGALEPKTSPRESGGSACSCASIKNYPMEFSMSPRAKDTPREENEFQSER